jgi:hypothetical protein
MNLSFRRLFFLVTACVCFITSSYGQARLVLNGAKMNITNGGSLVIANASSNAISRIDGHIISEGELNTIIWQMGTSTGTYVIPWGYGGSDYLPLSFTKTDGTGNGRIRFSTYHTGWENRLFLPTGITTANAGSTDLSAFIVDRYWQIKAQDYTLKPALQNLSFTYLEAEHTVPQNTIAETSLAAEQWNEVTNEWSAPVSGTSVNVTSNVATVAVVEAEEVYGWWTLTAGYVNLPLEFLSFDAKLEENKTRLFWKTVNEINVAGFDVQRSYDGNHFVLIGTVKAKGTTGTNDYLFFDEQLQNGKLFYRIRKKMNDGAYTYSEIRMVKVNTIESLAVYPNPVKGKRMMLNTTGLLPGQYQVSLFDLQGKLIYQSFQTFNRDILPIQLDAHTSKGSYVLKIIGGHTIFNKVILID